MIVTYLTGDNSLVSVCHMGTDDEGRAKWQVLVEGMGGIARWGVPNLLAAPGWGSEQVARHALEWAFALPDADGCSCPDEDCPGKSPLSAREAFGPTEPHEVRLTGPYFDRNEAIAAAAVQSGALDEYEIDEPTVEQLVAELDGTEPPPDEEGPDDTGDGSTWRLIGW